MSRNAGIKMICKVCTNSENNEEYRIREMMFGFGDEFTYFECLKCGCLQIRDIPGSMEKYYPANYLSSHRHRPLDDSVGRFLGIRQKAKSAKSVEYWSDRSEL